MWGTGCCPCSMPPLFTLVMDPKEQQGHYTLAPVTSQELPEWGWVQRQTALGTPTLDFSSKFTPEAIPKEGNCKATVIIARWPPLALQNWHPLTYLVLTSILVSNHPPHNLPCERWWVARLVANYSTPRQVVLGYRLPVASRLDLTWPEHTHTTRRTPTSNTTTKTPTSKGFKQFWFRIGKYKGPLKHRFSCCATKFGQSFKFIQQHQDLSTSLCVCMGTNRFGSIKDIFKY